MTEEIKLCSEVLIYGCIFGFGFSMIYNLVGYTVSKLIIILKKTNL